MISRKPWERRLEDLAQLLESCSASYFEPERFRRNTNQFLQTARTVTFIIQKNKSEIRDFERWYRKEVLSRLKDNPVMEWAKESRNKIEKEGDLEVRSRLSIALFYSYLPEEDIEIEVGRNELLNAGIKQLVRFARKRLPTGVGNVAGVKIEREWRSEQLEGLELLHALAYIYSQLHACCASLASHQGRLLPKSLPGPSDAGLLTNESRHVAFVKLRDLETYRFRTRRESFDASEIPDSVKERLERLRGRFDKPTDFNSAFEYYSSMATLTMEQWGNHIPMVFLLNRDWSIQDMLIPVLADQADKYFFWRTMAEKVALQSPHCLVHTSEIWERKISKNPALTIQEMPIVGERLQVAAFDRDGNTRARTWPILREKVTNVVTLGEADENFTKLDRMFIFVPAMRAMGIELKGLPERRVTDA